MVLADVMTQLGNQLDTIAGLRVYDYVPDNVQVPAAVVAWPENYEFDSTYGRAVDHATFPVTVIVGRLSDRASRDVMSGYVDGSGAESIKAVLEAGAYTAMSSVRVARVDFSTVTVAGVDHLGAAFHVDVWGEGA